MRAHRVVGVGGVLALFALACQPSVFELNIGDCLNLPEGNEVADVETVDCAEPHRAEVFALPQLGADADAPYPGQEALVTEGQERCVEAFEAYVGRPYSESSIFSTALTPSQQSWESAGDREIVCLLVGSDQDQLLTGSKRDSGE